MTGGRTEPITFYLNEDEKQALQREFGQYQERVVEKFVR